MTTKNPTRIYHFILIIGILFIAFNLRPGITAVGPLIGTIRDDLGLANWSAGLLTSLPLVAFAIISPIVPRLGKKITNEWAMVIGLIILVVGMGIRSISVVFLLFVGTVLVGLGIAISNVLLPGVVKDKFPTKVALMTSVYSTTMGTFAAISSGLSIPFAKGLDWGWQVALLIWAVPAVIAMMIWIYIAKKNQPTNDDEIKYIRSRDGQIWRSPLAWQVALFMGFQSSLFYVTISWLPEILHSNGMSIATAGWMLSYTQIIGMPASFFVPVIAGRLKSQRSIVFILGSFSIFGYLGLLLNISNVVTMLSITLIGITLGGCFALALTFLGIRARNAQHAAELSGMAQSIGYSLAAIGPVCIGLLFDVTNTWNVPLTVLIVISVLVILFGMGAGRDRYVL